MYCTCNRPMYSKMHCSRQCTCDALSWLVHLECARLECARPLALCTYKMPCCSRQCIKTACLSEDVHMQQCIVDVHIHDAACTRLE
mmetsp:Transcript_2784/g.3948  ORF Transcript_2784/g.3948 Transcript_2784/m.3948 type:complete len:86 (+) Transcript_2784:1-258(+)